MNEQPTSLILTDDNAVTDDVLDNPITLSNCFPAWPDTGSKPKALKKPDTRLFRRLLRDPAEEAVRIAQYDREYALYEHDMRRHRRIMFGREVFLKNLVRENRRKTTRTERRHQSTADKLARRDREARRSTFKIDLLIAGDEEATEHYRKKVHTI